MSKTLNEKVREYNRKHTKNTVKDIVFDQLRELGYTVSSWDDVKALVDECGAEPINYISGQCYSGVNRLLLDDGQYLTWNQIQNCCGRVKRGATSRLVVYCSPSKTGKKTVLKYYRVFDARDVEGIPLEAAEPTGIFDDDFLFDF